MAAVLTSRGCFCSFHQRLCLSLLGRLVGSERERLLKQAEISSPGESAADKREEMEVAMQQVGHRTSSTRWRSSDSLSRVQHLSLLLCPGVRQHHGVLPDAAPAQLDSGSVQHLPLQPVGQRAGRQGRRKSRSAMRRSCR